MTTLYPTGTDSWQDPQDTDALSTSPDGRDHQQHHADLNAVALAMEQQLVGPVFTSSGAYSDTAAEVVTDSESLTPANGAWGSSGGHSGATPTLDATLFTEGANSVTCSLDFPSGGGTTGKMYFDLTTPMTVGTHTALTMDCQFHIGSGSGAQGGFRVVASDGAALTGTVVASDVTQDTADLWFSISIPLTGLTSLKSVGIGKNPTHSGSGAKWVTWWIDDIQLREATAVDAALADVTGAVVVPADYVATETQFADTYNDVRGVLDLRPASATHPGINGTYNLRDWRLDETGVEDVTEDLQRIFTALPDGSTLLAPATGVFRIDNTVTIGTGKRNITFDGQGSRWFQPTEVNSQLFGLAGTENTIRGMRAFSLNETTITPEGLAAGDPSHPIVGTPTVVGTTVELNAQLEQVEIAWRGDDEVAYYARDHNGINHWDFVLKDSAQVASDCKFTVMKPDGTVLQTTTVTLTSTPTTYEVAYTPEDLYLPLRVAVSKATATANTITLSSVTMYGRQRYDATLAFNHFVLVGGDSCRVEDCWAEGMGGDMVTTGGAQGLHVQNVNGRVVGRQGFSFNTGSHITLLDCEVVGAARHAIDFEPETTGVFVTDITMERCRFIDPGLGFIACTAYPHVRRVYVRDCDFVCTSDRGGSWITGGWWEGVLSGCSFMRHKAGLLGSITFQGRGVTISDCVAGGGLLLESGGRTDENALSVPADYIVVNGWRAYSPLDLFTSQITHYSSNNVVSLDGSYAANYA